MLIDLTSEQIVEFAENSFFRFGNTTFQIASSGETPRSTHLILEYRRRIANKTVRIYSDNTLNQKELSLIVANPFKFIDEHPFRH